MLKSLEASIAQVSCIRVIHSAAPLPAHTAACLALPPEGERKTFYLIPPSWYGHQLTGRVLAVLKAHPLGYGHQLTGRVLQVARPTLSVTGIQMTGHGSMVQFTFTFKFRLPGPPFRLRASKWRAALYGFGYGPPNDGPRIDGTIYFHLQVQVATPPWLFGFRSKLSRQKYTGVFKIALVPGNLCWLLNLQRHVSNDELRDSFYERPNGFQEPQNGNFIALGTAQVELRDFGAF